jgi:hypothetical protein
VPAIAAGGNLAATSEVKVALAVKVASQCGLTPQHRALERLRDEHKDDGLVVLGLPCNYFGYQRPGTKTEVVWPSSRLRFTPQSTRKSSAFGRYAGFAMTCLSRAPAGVHRSTGPVVPLPESVDICQQPQGRQTVESNRVACFRRVT